MSSTLPLVLSIPSDDIDVGVPDEIIVPPTTGEGTKRPPKPSRTAFICFVDAKREELQRRHASTGSQGILKLVSEQWRALSSRERAVWDEVSRKDKLRYIKEKKEYNGPWNLPKRRAKKDPNAPRRPMSAFLKFSQKTRPAVKAENPHMENTDISRLLGEMWRNASDNIRAPFVESELVERAEYNKKMKIFNQEKAQRDAASRTSHHSIPQYTERKYHHHEREQFDEANDYLLEPLAVHPVDHLNSMDSAVFRPYVQPLEDPSSRYPFRPRSNSERGSGKDQASIHHYPPPPAPNHDAHLSTGYRPGPSYYPPYPPPPPPPSYARGIDGSAPSGDRDVSSHHHPRTTSKYFNFYGY